MFGIGKFLTGVAGKLLGGLVDKGIDKATDRITDKATDSIFGPNNLPSQKDYDRYQQMLTSGADDEAYRDALKHNSFANNTLAGDLARYGEAQPFLRGVDRQENVKDIGEFGAARAEADKA